MLPDILRATLDREEPPQSHLELAALQGKLGNNSFPSCRLFPHFYLTFTDQARKEKKLLATKVTQGQEEL